MEAPTSRGLWLSLKANNKILLGYIHGLFGIKGWVKVFSYSRPRDQILTYKNWYLGANGERVFQLEQGRSHNESVLAKLVSVDNRDQAAALISQKIWVDEAELPALAADEYYWYQLVGLHVVDTNGNELGKIIRLLETGANDVMVLLDGHGVEHLVPYIMHQVIKEVNLVDHKMVVDWNVEF